MEDRFEPLNIEDEVLSVENSEKIIIAYPMFKIGQFIAEIKNVFQKHGYAEPKKLERWFDLRSCTSAEPIWTLDKKD